MTHAYHTECFDLLDNCTEYALVDKACMDKEHSEWMKINCKESCRFCRGTPYFYHQNYC